MTSRRDVTDVMDAARAGEAWAFEVLFARLAGPLHGFVRARGADDPEGLTNEVLLRAFRKIGSVKGGEEEFRSWMFAIARNALVDEHRRAMRRPSTRPVDPHLLPVERGPHDSPGEAAGDDGVEALLAGLSEDQREVVLLRVVGDLSLEQTAYVTGKSEGAVKSLQHRALAQLRRKFSREAVSR